MTDPGTAGLPPAGWYDDPLRLSRQRHWDGSGWTDWVYERGEVVAAPIDVERGATALTRGWPGSVVGECVGGFLLVLIVAAFAYGIAAAAFGESDALVIVATTLVQYAGFVVIARRVSRRYGSGRLFDDLGWRVRRGDLWPGLGTGVLATIVTAAIVLSLGAVLGATDEPIDQFGSLNDSPTQRLIIGVVAIVGAPLFEELFFRGLLMPAMLRRGRTFAIAVSSMLFGAIHLNPELVGVENVIIFTSTAVTGAVLAWSALRNGRLGPAMIGHMLFNLPLVLVLLDSSG